MSSCATTRAINSPRRRTSFQGLPSRRGGTQRRSCPPRTHTQTRSLPVAVRVTRHRCSASAHNCGAHLWREVHARHVDGLLELLVGELEHLLRLREHVQRPGAEASVGADRDEVVRRGCAHNGGAVERMRMPCAPRNALSCGVYVSRARAGTPCEESGVRSTGVRLRTRQSQITTWRVVRVMCGAVHCLAHERAAHTCPE